MNKISFFSLIFIIIGLSLTCKAISDDSQDAPLQMTTSEPLLTVQDEDAPLQLTTSEPLLTVQDAVLIKNCSSHETCEDCLSLNSSCYWLDCTGEQYCDEVPQETCNSLECKKTTTTPPPTTTTAAPPNTTTTEETTTVTTEPPTTTENTNTTTAPTTTTPTTTTTNATTTTPATTTTNTTTTTPATTTANATTTSPATTSTTTEAPHHRHFDAGSFVGGMILALTLTAVAFAGWKFYRRRALSTSYTNF